MLSLMRKWVYQLGFRPKPGSIFFSPSRHLIEQIRGVDMNTTMVLGSGATIIPLEKPQSVEEYLRSTPNCPSCNGWFLVVNDRFPDGKWVRHRETAAGLTCRKCGFDYGATE